MARRQKYFSLLLLTVIIFTIGSFAAGDSSYSTEKDPLVSLSYVESLREKIVNDLYSRIDDGTMKELLNTFHYVMLTKGQQLVSKGSCEIILRAGTGTVEITDQLNINAGVGFSDLTGACEVTNGMSVARNHLLMSSAGDGRIINVTSNTAHFMVRGDYQVVG